MLQACRPKPHFHRRLFRRPATLPTGSIQSAFACQCPCSPTTAPARSSSPRHGSFQVDVVFSGQMMRPAPARCAPDAGTASDRFQIVEDVGTIKLAVEDQRTRAVMHKFRTFIKRTRSRTFIRFDNKERAAARARGNSKARYAADHEARFVPRTFPVTVSPCLRS